MDGSDYTAAGGTLTFAPGETTKNILLVAIDDIDMESNETFTVTLSNATGGVTINDPLAVATIVDDDASRLVTIDDVTTVEGDDTPHYRGAFVDSPVSQNFYPLTFGPDGLLYTSSGVSSPSTVVTSSIVLFRVHQERLTIRPGST